MAELEDEFRGADGKAVFIVETPAQDERVVIESKVCGIQEQDFPDLGERILETLSGKVDVRIFRGAPHQLGKPPEAVDRRETIALEDDLGFEIVNLVERMAVAVPSLPTIEPAFSP
jgi:hypothetical protein